MRAIGVYTAAFILGAVGGSILLGSLFYWVMGSMLLQRLGAITAVLSVVTGFYLAYRWALLVREWIFRHLDRQIYGFGLMLFFLTMYVFMGSMGWRLVMQTYFWRLSEPMTAQETLQQWHLYDFFQLKDYRLNEQKTLSFTAPHNAPEQPQQRRFAHAFVVPFEGTLAQDTLWLGYSVQSENHTIPQFQPSGKQYFFFKKLPFVEQTLYEQAILQQRGKTAAAMLPPDTFKIVEGVAMPISDYRYRIYFWILPYIGFGALLWFIGIALANWLKAMIAKPS